MESWTRYEVILLTPSLHVALRAAISLTPHFSEVVSTGRIPEPFQRFSLLEAEDC